MIRKTLVEIKRRMFFLTGRKRDWFDRYATDGREYSMGEVRLRRDELFGRWRIVK